MKVLQVAHNFPPQSWAGTEIYTLGLSLALKRRGVEVEVIYPVAKGGAGLDRIDMNGLTVWRQHLQRAISPFSGVVDSQSAKLVCDVAQHAGCELIHAQHLLGFSGEVIVEAHRRGIPTVLTLHDFWAICPMLFMQRPDLRPCPGHGPENCLQCLMEMMAPANPAQREIEAMGQFLRLRDQFHRQVLALPHKVLTVSHFVHRVMAQCGLAGPNMAVLPAGIAPFALDATPPPRQGDDLIFACLGNITPNKGFMIAAQAVRGVKGARLRIHGKAANRLYSAGLLALTRQNQSNIRYKGPYDLSQRGAILAQCDAVIVPSMMESYCLVAREALYAGRPVLASDVGGIPEAVEHGRNGLLFPPGDSRRLGELVRELAAEPSRLATLGRGVRPPHTTAQDAADYEAIYGQALAGG